MSLHLDWPSAKPPQPISQDQIHVWAWAFNFSPVEPPNTNELDPNELASDVEIHPDLAVLDPDEAARLRRFRFERDRRRFAIAHVNMRRILGAYLRQPPAAVTFRANRFGKPERAGKSGPRIRFNLSHSQSLALLAISPEIEVGVDAEDLREIEPEVAQSHFSAAELAALATLHGDDWLRGFYHCWTRKEAILKAEGVGLNCPLDAFDVSLLPGVPAELLGARPGANFHHAWKLHDLSPATGTAAALAASSAHAKVACFALQ